MKESDFVKIFEEAAKKVLRGRAKIERGVNLYYSLSLDRNLCLSTPATQNPKRGASAFQTDICIFENLGEVKFPRVVIEFKENITTHDIITYSAKAGRHKLIYPWLRYGLLVRKLDSIPRKFFMHNEHLDFFIAAENYSGTEKIGNMAHQLIARELKTSQTLEKIHFSGMRVDYFCRDIIFEEFSK